MARGRYLTVTAPEREALALALEALAAAEGGVLFPVPRRVSSALRGLLDKANAAVTPVQREEPGLSLAAVEAALGEAGARYAVWVSGSPARFLGDLHRARATEEQLRLVGRYIASWPHFQGTLTLASIARRWGEWLSGATAWESRRGTEAATGAPGEPTEPSHWG